MCKINLFYCLFLWSNVIIAKIHITHSCFWSGLICDGKYFQIHNLESVPRVCALYYTIRDRTAKTLSSVCSSVNIFTTKKKYNPQAEIRSSECKSSLPTSHLQSLTARHSTTYQSLTPNSKLMFKLRRKQNQILTEGGVMRRKQWDFQLREERQRGNMEQTVKVKIKNQRRLQSQRQDALWPQAGEWINTEKSLKRNWWIEFHMRNTGQQKDGSKGNQIK